MLCYVWYSVVVSNLDGMDPHADTIELSTWKRVLKVPVTLATMVGQLVSHEINVQCLEAVFTMGIGISVSPSSTLLPQSRGPRSLEPESDLFDLHSCDCYMSRMAAF